VLKLAHNIQNIMLSNTVEDVFLYAYKLILLSQEVLLIIQQENVFKNVLQSLIIFQIIQLADVCCFVLRIL
jgi:hypothetical protein